VLRRASLSIGVREEVYGTGENFFAPGLNAGYWLSSKLKARAAVSRAFRLPSSTELYYHDPANVGNGNLKPEQAWNYEGGVNWIPSERWRLSGTVFERRERNDIGYVRANANAIWQATNFSRVHFTGFEASLLQSKYAFNYPVQQAVLAWQGAAKG